ncbi:Mycolic acid cyclopropane synthetase-domain-containing protein [Blyttiomyces helicus]|uniref:Mycolic acid cyclopropane synthetase-domain-containing protein n=1 Tax=Blyttiomyces helicus TaxID=388810 RepID=A0A4P9WB30_9FUNG|nr:Mycolic acid cyclopropane synthetase-domain-containing protein [Blyttiomyces helicus]|eukprot:RKO88110.1 Mycolic acid cyclopropane synthetase-domain-containing protein [Blyttiomyces helicus]
MSPKDHSNVTRTRNWPSLVSSLPPWRHVVAYAQSTILSVLGRVKVGHIKVTLLDGSVRDFGDIDAPKDQTASIKVVTDVFWVRLAVWSALGLGEGYMYSDIEVENLTGLLIILARNRENIADGNVLPAGLNFLLNNFAHSRIPNTIMNALGNIQAHYDLGNEMFASFLDPTMTYSCPIWALEGEEGFEDDNLEKAQMRKIRAMIDKGCISKDHHVLEIGTGWGALAIEAVRRTGCRVTSLTLSIEQKELAERRIEEAGLSSRITVLLTDYRDLDPKEHQFDRILTVEMLEAVGPEFLPVFFRCCDALLSTRDGILVLQVITMPDARYQTYLRKIDFIQKHIFPGGHCPSITALTNGIYEGSAGNLIVDRIDNIGPHYAKALRLWREKFLASFDRIASQGGMEHVYDDVFKRKWEFYFAYCEAGFATRTLGDIQMVLTRAGNMDSNLMRGIPM